MISTLLFACALALPQSTPEYAAETGPGPTPPNILLVVADDIGVDNVGVYNEGPDLPNTPFLDSIAANGVLFRNAYANPVCSPSRAAIMTGRPAFRTGVGWAIDADVPSEYALQIEEWTLPELLDLGTGGLYGHAAIGKWHLGNGSVGGDLAPNMAGFQHFAGAMSNFDPPEGYYNWRKVVNGVASISTTYATTDQVDEASAWIQAAPGPWFCYLAFNAAHFPWQAPPPSLHTVDLTEPDNRKHYKAMVEALDTELARLWNSFSPQVQASTMLVFVGDNGTPEPVIAPPLNPKHGKKTMYEGGVNVPLLVSGPLVTSPGRESQVLVSITDLFATVLDIADTAPAQMPAIAGLDSISIVPYLADPQTLPKRPWVTSEMFRPKGPLQRPSNFILKGADPLCVGPVCQTDYGFAGEGNATMTLCGEPIFGGEMDGDQYADIVITGAPPNAPGTLFSSTSLGLVPAFGGTLVPGPSPVTDALTTDENGTYTFQVIPVQPPKPGAKYYQAAITDPSQPSGFALTNAIEAQFLGTDMECIRDERYKLILNNKKCNEAFYNLTADPFETNDLLADGLTPAETLRYVQLKSALLSLRDPLTIR